MQSVLIVESSEVLRTALVAELQKTYCVFCCENGEDGLILLKEKCPDALIINLFLQGMNGLLFLESIQDFRPEIIISLSYIQSPYILQSLKDLGVGFPILLPASEHEIAHRLGDMFQKAELPFPLGQQEVIAEHLSLLNLTHPDAHKMLRVGVPLFAQDQKQSFTKELYPSIAILCGCNNWKQVESTLRRAIRQAWKKRNDEVWKRYFPDISRCPTSSDFIKALAKLL